MRRRQISEKDSPILLLYAVLIGIIVVGISILATSTVTGRVPSISTEWVTFLILTVIVSFPFLLLALLGVKGLMPWVVGIILTAMLWAFALFQALSSLDDGTGANIGLGLLIVASPLPISIACMVASKRELKGQTQPPQT